MTRCEHDKICSIVAHDAGGAELLSSFVRRNDLRCTYVLHGPAVKVFERKLGKIDVLPLEESIVRSHWVLTGTSWQSDLECDAIRLASKLGKRSVAFLDHWVNYRERFERDGELCLPNELWVGDTVAAKMAKALFPDNPVSLIENPYFIDVCEEANEYPSNNSNSTSIDVLYVSEPLSEHAMHQYGDERYRGYTENDAINYFLSNLQSLENALKKKIRNILIRPHPSESKKKYSWVKKEFKLPIEISNGGSLVREIQLSDVVVGCSSMALVVGCLLNKKVISCIPTGNAPSLPHPEIKVMADIIK